MGAEMEIFMAEPARKLSLASKAVALHQPASGPRGPVRLRPVPPVAPWPDLTDRRERHHYRARFWQVALPGLALFWGSAIWLVVS